jgi:LacI family transcriptional regulator
MSCNDTVGGHILERCLDLKLNVPEEVMIIGVDNDESVSELIRPGLSSIALDLEGIGTKATELLWKVLKGYPTDPVVLFPPKGVVVRGSTQPHPDPLLAKLIAEIQTSAINGQPLKEIIDAAPVCRMTIERRFRRLVGRTPLQEIRRVRINRAKELLGSTNLPLKAIADQSGFATPSRLIESFIRETGIRPTDYRGQRKVGASGSVKLPQSSGRCADTGKRGSTSSAKSQSTSKSTGSVKIVSLGSLDKTARYNGSTC